MSKNQQFEQQFKALQNRENTKSDKPVELAYSKTRNFSIINTSSPLPVSNEELSLEMKLKLMKLDEMLKKVPTMEDFIKELKTPGGKYQIETRDIKGMPIDQRWGGSGLAKIVHDTTLTGEGTSASPLSVLEAGNGTVTNVSVITANGISGTVNNPSTTPEITLDLGDITPSAIDMVEETKEMLCLRRTGVFNFVQYKRAAGAWTNITTEAGISLGSVSGDVLDAIGDTFVIGKTTTFNKIYIDVGTAISTGGTFLWEYSKGGDTWATIPDVVDGTATVLGALAQDGVVSFTPPVDWATDSQNSSAQLYFVRLRVSAGSFTTEPTVYLVVPNDGLSVVEVYANGGDTLPSFSVSRNGSVVIGADPNVSTTSRMYVGGSGSILGNIIMAGTLSGATTGAFSGQITQSTASTTDSTTTIGMLLAASTASSGTTTVRKSPRLNAYGRAWNGSADRYTRFTEEIIPATGATPTAKYRTSYALGTTATDGTEVTLTELDSEGNLAITGTLTSGGVSVPTISSTSTLTNKRITQRVVTTTDDSTAVIDVAVTDVYELSAVANATTFSFTGTPTDGQKIMIRFKDAGVAKGLTWTGFTAIGVTLPTTTVAGKWHYVGVTYNTAASTWHAIAVGVEA